MAAESAAVAPSAASASTAPRERLNTCTVWPAANKRCVIGRPIFPRPMKPTCIVARVPAARLAGRGYRRQASACLVDLTGQWMTDRVDDEARRFEDLVEMDAV